MKRTARRLVATVCCLLAAATLIFPQELGATLTQPPWLPSDPGVVPKPAPVPVDPTDDEEASDSQRTGDAGKQFPSPTPAHRNGAER